MRKRHGVSSQVFAGLMLAAVSGCQSLHAYRPVPIEVMDAETSTPIQDMNVRIVYPMAQTYFAPFESVGTTGADGIAHLRGAPYGPVGVTVELIGKGYLLEQKFLTTQELEAIPRAGWFEDVQHRPRALQVQLFAEPRATIDLVLPSAYRGIVKVKVHASDDFPKTAEFVPGKRNFTFDVPDSGEIVVKGPPLFKHVVAADLRFRFADGTAITPKAKECELGYWWLRQELQYDVFLVGIQRDYDDLRRAHSNRRIGDSSGESHSRWRHKEEPPPFQSSPPGILGMQPGLNPSVRDFRPSGLWSHGMNP